MSMDEKEQELALQYMALVRNIAMSVANTHTLHNMSYHDLVSIGYLHTVELIHNGAYKKARNVKSFIGVAVKNRLLDVIYREGKYTELPDNDFVSQKLRLNNQDNDDVVDYSRMMSLVDALDGIDGDIMAKRLHRLLSISEICKELGLARSTVNKHIRRIKDELRAKFREGDQDATSK